MRRTTTSFEEGISVGNLEQPLFFSAARLAINLTKDAFIFPRVIQSMYHGTRDFNMTEDHIVELAGLLTPGYSGFFELLPRIPEAQFCM